MFEVNQEIQNDSDKTLEIYPRRTIKRINIPDTIDFFILHEGLISISNEKLYEKKYKKLLKECSDQKLVNFQEYCRQVALNGWLGFTDKYWMSVLIPNQSENYNLEFKHYNYTRDIFLVRYSQEKIKIMTLINFIGWMKDQDQLMRKSKTKWIGYKLIMMQKNIKEKERLNILQ